MTSKSVAPPAKQPSVIADESAAEGERIAKVMARAGICSRRDAERMIAEGRVAVDGKVLDSPGVRVGPASRIVVDGKPIPAAEAPRLWRYHKPAGLVTSHRDPEGRPTVFERLPEDLPRVISIGRLDLNSEGLLLLTNDGTLARRLELPATGWVRRYRVRCFGRVVQAELDPLARGLMLDGIQYGPIEARVDSAQGGNIWLTMGLREGKNREVRRVLEHIGLKVNRLIRVSYGPFQLGQITPGTVEEVPRRVLRDQLGSAPGGAPPTANAGKAAAGKAAAGKAAAGKIRAREAGGSGPRAPKSHAGEAGGPGPRAPRPHAPKSPASGLAALKPHSSSSSAPKSHSSSLNASKSRTPRPHTPEPGASRPRAPKPRGPKPRGQ